MNPTDVSKPILQAEPAPPRGTRRGRASAPRARPCRRSSSSRAGPRTASRPPADGWRRSSRRPTRRSPRSAAVTGTGAGAAGARVPRVVRLTRSSSVRLSSRSCDACALIVSWYRLIRRSDRTRVRSWCSSNGFCTKSSAPASIACRFSCQPLDVTMITGRTAVSSRSRILRQTVYPSISGITTSRSTRSGFRRLHERECRSARHAAERPRTREAPALPGSRRTFCGTSSTTRIVPVSLIVLPPSQCSFTVAASSAMSHGLGQIPVEPRSQKPLTVAAHCLGGHSEDGMDDVRSSDRSWPSASTPSTSGKPDVHQDEIGCVRRARARIACSCSSSPRVSGSPYAERTSRNSFMFFSLSSTMRTYSPAIARGLHREGERERLTVPELTVDADAAAVQLDQALGQGKPEARAPRCLMPASACWNSRRAQVILGRDAGSSLRHRAQDSARRSFRAHLDGAAGRCELQSVGQQVVEDLPDATVSPRTASRSGSVAHAIRTLLRRRSLSHHRQAVRACGGARTRARARMAGLDLGQVEDVVDQREQVVWPTTGCPRGTPPASR